MEVFQVRIGATQPIHQTFCSVLGIMQVYKHILIFEPNRDLSSLAREADEGIVQDVTVYHRLPIINIPTLLMVQKSRDHHLGCTKPCIHNGINYQTQLMFAGFLQQ